LDPRIRAERKEKEAKKREEKERRARIKQEEEEARQRQEAEKRRREEQEQAEREERERVEREQRKQSKEVLKKMRQRLKKSVVKALTNEEMEEVQEFGLTLDVEPLEALCAKVEAQTSASEVQDVIRLALADWKVKRSQELEEQSKQREEARKRDEKKNAEAKEAASVIGAGWCAEELGLLAKGLQKFPGGQGGRWALIQKFISSGGYERTEREVIDKTKELSEGKSLRAMGSTLVAGKVSEDAAAVKPSAAHPKATAKAAVTETLANAGTGAAVSTSTSDWTAEQQRAFEAALQRHPATLDKNERWRLIAEDVPGKTKAQCVERFKYLREQVAKQKSG